MKNGDRLTGEVKGLTDGVLYVSLDYVDGTISVQWSKVARLESSQLFIVKLENGAVYTGTLSTIEASGSQPVKIQIAETTEKKTVVASSQVVKMAETSEKFMQRFSGEISTGIIYSKGNQSTQFNLGSEITYPRERWEAGARFDSNLSSNSGDPVSTRNQLGLNYRHLLPGNKNFYGALASFLQSSEQGINLRTTFGGGLGRYLKDTNRTNFSVLGGLTWQRTHYELSGAPTSTENVATGIILAELKVFKFKKTRLNAYAALFPAISDPGRVVFATNDTFYVKLFSNLSWNVSFYANWDSRPPPNFSGSDYGTSSGLSWTFGNR
ncbi:MAG: DUF481 domain-containing protein [Acidobacteria bacterium]|nr:DUF481 domain-containing protein [Acidobacteriota bacterium]